VGQGGFLLGMIRGFEAMQRAGRIKSVPVPVGVQAHACAPLWALISYGPAGLSWSTEGQTVAEGIRVSHPLRGDALIKALETYQGLVLAVDDGEILRGQAELARLGFYVEPTSAVVWAAIHQAAGRLPEPVVAVLTGSGLKSSRA
jgi:threonine synthase